MRNDMEELSKLGFDRVLADLKAGKTIQLSTPRAKVELLPQLTGLRHQEQIWVTVPTTEGGTHSQVWRVDGT